MSKISPCLLVLSIAVVGGSLAVAQDTTTVPKVLQITREFTKPYKGGAAHDKTESAFVTAQARAKFPGYYIALSSMSGKSRALFLTPYDSFETWGKENDIAAKNKVFTADMERAGIADGELLDSVDSEVFTYDDELSYKPHPDLTHARYMEISVFRVRPGHRKEWYELGKMFREAYEKAGTSAHWAMFEVAFGTDDGTYIALSADQSMADIDKEYAENKKFVEAIGGEEAMQKFDQLYGETVESSHTELFAINPKQSYVSDDFIKGDPDFWKPKLAAASALKPAADVKKDKP